MATNIERHQFGFSFMRSDTGGQKVKAFWGNGNREDAEKSCIEQAKRYCYSYQNELNEKARMKSHMRGDRYAPSPIHVDIVGRSFWR